MNQTAIVIDDDIDSVDIFSSLLEEYEISVVGKGFNGREAIDLFQNLKPDLVFLDLNMPDGTGFHAIRGIKKIDPSAKIIAVTANESSLTQKKLAEYDLLGIIFKPIDMEKVVNLIS